MNSKFETTLERPLRLLLNQELIEEHRPIPSSRFVEPPVPSRGKSRAANGGLEAPRRDFQRILVATDFSLSSSYAISYAYRLAKRLKGKLILLYVALPLAGHEASVTSRDAKRRAKELRQHAEKMLSEQLHETLGLATDDPALFTEIIEGYAYEDIVKEAAAKEADIIVIARHGHSETRSLPLGPTADAVVRNARCPVMLVGE